MKVNSAKIRVEGDRKIPRNVHTIFSFKIPYAIPVPDGTYRVRVGKHIAEIAVKRIQRKQVGRVEASRPFQMAFDKYGKSSFSFIEIKIPWRIDLSEKGRKPLLLEDGPWRNKAKEIVLRFLNRFIGAVRYVTEEYWVESARYQDVTEYKVFYWDGKKRYPVAFALLDSGVGGIRIGSGHPFQIKAEKMQELKTILFNQLELDASKIFMLNSKDACLQEDFGRAIVEAVTALEMVLSRFIRRQGEKLDIPKKKLENFIADVGLTGNVTVVLKMLTKGLEQIDKDTLGKCKGAIKIRNKILHEGFRKVTSTDTEERIIAMERMIAYLKRLLASL